jgi:hypothetical protein
MPGSKSLAVDFLKESHPLKELKSRKPDLLDEKVAM